MKIFFKLFITILFLIFITLMYLSIFGVETDKFNSQITEKIRKFDKNLEVELKEIKLILDPFQFKLQAKTIGTNLINQSKKIEIENIKTQLSLKSLIENKFSIENLEISSKSLELKNLISFLRSFQNTPELFIMEKAIKKAYLIADIKLEFDSNGNIKSNYEINGLVKDIELNVLKKYNLQKLDFIFDYSRNNFLVKDLNFKFDKIGISSEKVSFKKKNDDFFVDGTLAHKKSDLEKRNIDLLVKSIKPNFKKLGPTYGKYMKEISTLVNSLDNYSIIKLEKTGKIDLLIDKKTITFDIDDFEISSKDIEGWLVANDGNITVALDIKINDELRNEGIAREVVSKIQNLRKSEGFEVTDRINLIFNGDEEIQNAINKNLDYVKSETLSNIIQFNVESSGGTDIIFDKLKTKIFITKV